MKSLIVAIVLLLIAFFTVVFILRAVNTHKDIWLRLKYSLAASVLAVLLVLGIHIYGLNLYPFERQLDPVPFAAFSVPEEFELDYPGQKFWTGAYKIGNRESMYFDVHDNMSMYGFPWPPMDFEHFSYIITYGQKIESLSYNAWDMIDIPVQTGAIAGRMVLNEEFNPEMVYIYSIPRLPIENDVNDVTGVAID